MPVQSLVSIIVPVYNVEKYLQRAVQSARQQTYSNIEIILVDDGSTDLSGVICEQEKTRDERIIVIHKANAGPSSARNAGIAVAKGKYIFFLDSDDRIVPETIDIMVKTIEEKQCDLVICGILCKYVNADGIIHSEKSMLLDKEGYYRPIDLFLLFRSDDESKKNNVEASWNKLYQRNMFESRGGIFPENLQYAEDAYFLMDFLDKCQSIYYIKKELYHYYRYSEVVRKSLMNSYNGNRFAIYKKLYLKQYNKIHSVVSDVDIARCKHNFADKVILTCIILCRVGAPYSETELIQRLHDIVWDELVIDAMPYYNRKPNNSWTIPLLIKRKKVEYLLYFARKIAKKRYS